MLAFITLALLLLWNSVRSEPVPVSGGSCFPFNESSSACRGYGVAPEVWLPDGVTMEVAEEMAVKGTGMVKGTGTAECQKANFQLTCQTIFSACDRSQGPDALLPVLFCRLACLCVKPSANADHH